VRTFDEEDDDARVVPQQRRKMVEGSKASLSWSVVVLRSKYGSLLDDLMRTFNSRDAGYACSPWSFYRISTLATAMNNLLRKLIMQRRLRM
jgi:hypothetical protein